MQIYEALHPETRQGGAPGNKGGGRGKAPIKPADPATLIAPAFAEATAEATGRSSRVVREL